jgi:hypothetical protein
MAVTADPRIGRTARTALMSVRFTQVQIQRPANLNTEDYPPSISLYAVEVEEVNPSNGQVAVHWRLMTTHEIGCLEPTLEGHTRKQHNPHPKTSLPWAIWIVARLGGWSGYRSQVPPGMPTLVKGLRRFESIFEGWKLSQIRLVYKR